jgi:hypothetical protein
MVLNVNDNNGFLLLLLFFSCSFSHTVSRIYFNGFHGLTEKRGIWQLGEKNARGR